MKIIFFLHFLYKFIPLLLVFIKYDVFFKISFKYVFFPINIKIINVIKSINIILIISKIFCKLLFFNTLTAGFITKKSLFDVSILLLNSINLSAI